MNTPCPHCQIQIEIDPETLVALQGHAHFECPACKGPVPVPPAARAPVKVTAAAAIRPVPVRPPASIHKGLNRNFLIFGSAALFVIGGIGFYLASQKSGGTNTGNQNIRNEIINNSYFQNLINSGVTSVRDLDAIAAIRPYGNGFIGISAEPMAWTEANDLARRTGSAILAVDPAVGSQVEELASWIKRSFPKNREVTLWLAKDNSPAVLAGTEVLAVSGSEGSRRAVLRWTASKGVENNTSDPKEATKDRPFVNRLGMRFVPIPITSGPSAGNRVLFSIWETRVKDYEYFAAQNSNVRMAWKNVIIHGHKQADDHPVIHVSQRDAIAFCEWLTKQDGIKYRLPTDHEWSCAVGIGEMEDPDVSPREKDGRITDIFPWGGQWTPPPGAGNYYGEEGSPSWTRIPGFRDQHPITAPVGSYLANRSGLFDLGGNVWELTASESAPSSGMIVARGAAWSGFDPSKICSSRRDVRSIDSPAQIVGFRVVCE